MGSYWISIQYINQPSRHAEDVAHCPEVMEPTPDRIRDVATPLRHWAQSILQENTRGRLVLETSVRYLDGLVLSLSFGGAHAIGRTQLNIICQNTHVYCVDWPACPVSR